MQSPSDSHDATPDAIPDAPLQPQTKPADETIVAGAKFLVRSPSSRGTSSAPLSVPRPRDRPGHRNSVRRYARRVLRRYYEWKNAHAYLGRYSIEKMVAFEEYQRLTSPARVFAVIVLTPLPALLTVMLLASIPLQSPLLPATSHAAYFVQSWLSFSVVTFGMLLYMRCALALPLTVYSHQQCVLISVLTAGANEILVVFVSMLWRFPVPCRGLVGAPSYAVLFLVFHKLILRRKLRHFQDRIRGYLPSCLAQVSTFIVFEAVAILFQKSPVWAKTAIVVSYPLLRGVLKRFVRRFSGSLEDISTESTVCVVEIFGSFFQNVFLQSSCSVAVSGFLILVDVGMALVELWMYLDHKFTVDGRVSTQTAIKIIEHAFFPGALKVRIAIKQGNAARAHAIGNLSSRGVSVALSATDVSQRSKRSRVSTRTLTRVSTRTSTRTSRRASMRIACSADKSVDVGAIDLGVEEQTTRSRVAALLNSSLGTVTPKPRQSSIDDTDVVHRHHVKLLSHTLQLVFASEVLVFAEYSEVACALIYGLYSLAVYQMANAKYMLPFSALAQREFWETIANSAIYTVLEAVTLAFLFSVVRAKLGFSAFYQLAFVLEKYWMSVQGKILASFVPLFVRNTVHQGWSS
jgi:hypothetical protein